MSLVPPRGQTFCEVRCAFLSSLIPRLKPAKPIVSSNVHFLFLFSLSKCVELCRKVKNEGYLPSKTFFASSASNLFSGVKERSITLNKMI